MKRIVCIAVLIAVLFPWQDIYAQSTTTISVAPAIIEIAANPGDTIEKSLFIKNDSQQALPISLAVESMVAQRNELTKPKTEFDASQWFSFAEKNFILEAQQQLQVPFTVAIPEGASAGGHYAQISVRGLYLEPASNNASSIVVPEVTVNTLLTISGDITESIRIDGSNIVPWQATPSQELQAEFNISNTGNVHGLAAPELVLQKNGEETRYQFAPRVILPGDTINFRQIWLTPPKYGTYNAFIEIRFGNQGELYRTSQERITISPSLTMLVNTAVFTWLTLYLLRHRMRIKPAFRTLLKKQY